MARLVGMTIVEHSERLVGMTIVEHSELTLPVGTQVVTRVAVPGPAGSGRMPLHPRGAVGAVTAVEPGESGTPGAVDDGRPTDRYRVRFADGSETILNRADLRVRKQERREAIGPRDDDQDTFERLSPYVAYRCVVGSRAYGLDDEGSDVDRRGFYLPPAALHWSLHGVPEQLEDKGSEECYWELQKFLTMALKANPNVLECLYTPLVETATPIARELLAMRDGFLSRLVYQTYNGYVLSQFKRLEQDLRTTGALRWKHAMHLIRLLLAGTTVLREGTVVLRVEGERERLLSIRRGELPWDEVDDWRLALHREFDAAFATTHLPDGPDYERADAFLIRARRDAVGYQSLVVSR